MTVNRSDPPVDETAVRVTRTGAYALVVADGAVLLTQLSQDTPAPGIWTLPGGGVDHGEAPDAAVVRELLEETGHAVVGLQLLEVTSDHFVGRSPSGRLEDFHGISVIYRAGVERVEEPEVLDVGGSTSAAAWVPLTELASLPLGRHRMRLARLLGMPSLMDAEDGPWDAPAPPPPRSGAH